MRISPRFTTLGGVAALLSALFVGGPVTATAAPVPVSAPFTTSAPAPGADARPGFASVGSVCYSALPSQAHDTLALIDAGGPFPYPQDGTVFQNRERVLPRQNSGYYHEYTVITPGSRDRGARRIVTGERSEEDYWTADHYETFALVDHDC
ncbi:ribonuclease domain-containing protein [Streptomyces sp. DT24]|uniref:ribonuclease domain-containing protein n=1 Tax=unclassified Streptomyces TaxID=2593676 RepID=UPI0023B8A94B|nr:ribonuclease domain-containing protein [Streptomyces sp. AM 4-1-1]WEH36546.1 ribonuclease domain-containing protein [Streptomyces sp. AM 4-1-1]